MKSLGLVGTWRWVIGILFTNNEEGFVNGLK
jgi:hypothetical protein